MNYFTAYGDNKSKYLALKKSPNIDVYQGDVKGFGVNSTLLHIDGKGILFDCQFNKTNAEQLANFIHSKVNNLLMVIITHPHPDHYMGTAVIKKHFPNVPFYISRSGITEIQKTIDKELAIWAPIYTTDLSAKDELPVFNILPQDSIMFNEYKIQIYQDMQGDVLKQSNSFFWIPDRSTLIAGDIVFAQDVHVWLAESDKNSRERWINTIELIKNLNPTYIVTGHGLRQNYSKDNLQYTINYIRNFEKLLMESKNKDDLIAKLTKLYPNQQLKEILKFSADASFSNKKN